MACHFCGNIWEADTNFRELAAVRQHNDLLPNKDSSGLQGCLLNQIIGDWGLITEKEFDTSVEFSIKCPRSNRTDRGQFLEQNSLSLSLRASVQHLPNSRTLSPTHNYPQREQSPSLQSVPEDW